MLKSTLQIIRGDIFMKNYLEKAYCMNQTVRIYAAITTGIAQEAQEIHHLWPSSAIALTRTLTMAAIMSCTYKANEHLTIKVSGDGPVGQITVEATEGKVRGFIQNPGVYLAYNDGRINVCDAVGKNGSIEVIKDLQMRHPFSSASELVSGEIAQDFTYYFAQSEQIPSSVGLGERFNEDSKIIAAGGFLIQIMPGCKEEYISKLEKKLNNLKSCSQMILDGYTAEDMINEITDGDYQLLEKIELEYFCPCSRARFEKGLKSLGAKELKAIVAEDHQASITCNFCGTKYDFNEEELKSLISEIVKN